MRTPVWAWCALVGVIAALLALDLYAGRHATPSLRRALVTSGSWIGAGIGFGAVLGVLSGPDVASQYFAGYALEKSLSIDNVFVFAMIFTGLGVPSSQQRRVLFYGVVGALVLRAGFIAGGAAALQRFGWVLDAFAVFLLVAALRMARGGPHVAPGGSRAVRALARVLPVSAEADGERFWTRAGGRRAATPLLVALVAVEAADIAFAADSIPAIFGVTRDTFVIFASNAFAVLGLRALYLVFAGALVRFTYLRYGLAALLAFIGTKILVDPVVHISSTVTLGVVAVVIGASVAASLASARANPLRAGDTLP